MITLPTLPRHLLFDWGNTVMADDPARSDPMHEWPDVKTMPGADHVIPKLAATHTLSIATNAHPSRAPDVRKALARVGLDSHFTHVFTASDIGCPKQDPHFWATVFGALGVAATEACMIGDNLESDILPASRAGLMTIWYLARVDDALTMPHFASIRSLRELISQYQ